MYALVGGALQRARTVGHKFFHRLGIHCATHQIRLILISCLVITSLFYPALALYTSSAPSSYFSSRVLDWLVSPSPSASLDGGGSSARTALRDVRAPWAGYDALRVREDSVARARCGQEQTLRAERVLVHSTSVDPRSGVVSVPVLESALDLEERIRERLKVAKDDGTKGPGAQDELLVFSPLQFWGHDRETLLEDRNPLRTLSSARNVTVSGLPVSAQMVLAGRDDEDSVVHSASFLVLTYLFKQTECEDDTGHQAWLEVLRGVDSPESKVVEDPQALTLVALEFDSSRSSKSSRFSSLTAFCYLAYILFFIYFSGSMRKIATVHSRIGLAFTGLVEIVVSTFTSLSVCALVGFKITMVPWELVPIVVVFVGAENMFNLVDAVGKTSITLPVKERIAQGLSKAGTSNTLKVVSYNAVLGTLAAFSWSAIRQFCAFAVVVLVAHWFLVHTFFVTVLSIDLQRLELSEVLRQNASMSSPPLQKAPSTDEHAPKTVSARLLRLAKGVLRGRARTNVSLFLLLAITAALYYATYPATMPPPDARRSVDRPRTPQQSQLDSPASRIWNVLNPGQDPLVHIRIDSPTIVMFHPDASSQPTHDENAKTRPNNPRFATRNYRAIIWLFKILVLPISATMFALYGLCLYLLKDAELLEAQRNRPDADSPAVQSAASAGPIQDNVSFTTLPRAYGSDVELIAASAKGDVIASVGVHNEVVVWRVGEDSFQRSITVADVLAGDASTSSNILAVTALALDEMGAFLAVGTGAGHIGVWTICGDGGRPLAHVPSTNVASAVTDLRVCITKPSQTQGPPSTSQEQAIPCGMAVIAAFENGTAVKMGIGARSSSILLTPTTPAACIKSILLDIEAQRELGPLVAFCLEDGRLEVQSLDNPSSSILPIDTVIQAGSPSDLIIHVHAAVIDSDSGSRVILCASTTHGVVSLWDVQTSECIALLDEAFGDINSLRLCPIRRKTCASCGQLTPNLFSLTFSASNIVVFYRGLVVDTERARQCTCTSTPAPRYSGTQARLSRRASRTTFSGPSTPLVRSRASSFSNQSPPFPISSHGVHSRRNSEKDRDSLRLRSSDLLSLSVVRDDAEDRPYALEALANGVANGLEHKSETWRNVQVRRVLDTTFERGSWDVAEGRVIGLRRKPREASLPQSGALCQDVKKMRQAANGLTQATLERWELWLYDPLLSSIQASPLTALEVDGESCGPGRPAGRSKSDADVPRLPFTRVSSFLGGRSWCVAGFGNTVGYFQFAAASAR